MTNKKINEFTDSGDNWAPINSGLTSCRITTLAVSGTDLFAGISDSGIFRSADSGASWTNVSSGLTGNNVYSIAGSGENLFAGIYRGLFRSTDNGTNWEPVDLGIGTNPVVLSLAVLGTNLFVGTNRYGGSDIGGVYHSLDYGKTWLPYNNTGPYTSVEQLIVSGTSILAGTDGGGVFISTDSAQNWTQVNNGLTSTKISALYSYDDKLLAANHIVNNVYLSTDKASNWSLFNTGLTSDVITYSFVGAGENIFAGTTQGVWKRLVNEMVTSVKEDQNNIPKMFSLSQNYPNPFNPTTIIRYSIPQSSNVMIKVYDILGKEVKTIIDEFKQAGTYEVEFNSENLSSGIYFYRMTCNKFIGTKKFVVIK